MILSLKKQLSSIIELFKIIIEACMYRKNKNALKLIHLKKDMEDLLLKINDGKWVTTLKGTKKADLSFVILELIGCLHNRGEDKEELIIEILEI